MLQRTVEVQEWTDPGGEQRQELLTDTVPQRFFTSQAELPPQPPVGGFAPDPVSSPSCPPMHARSHRRDAGAGEAQMPRKAAGGLASVRTEPGEGMRWRRRRLDCRLLTCCAGSQWSRRREGRVTIAVDDSARLQRLSYDRSASTGNSICGVRRWTCWRGPRGWRWRAAMGRWRCRSWPPTARIRTPSSWSCRSPNDHRESRSLSCAAA